MGWLIEISQESRQDIKDILTYTLQNFGEEARLRYNALIDQSLDDIAGDLDFSKAKIQTIRGTDFLTYHLKSSKDKARVQSGIVKHPRHIVFYLKKSENTLNIVRVLRERRDFTRHLGSDEDEE